jgi:hypothetical protein
MAAADLHNLVFQLGGDVRIIPAVQAPWLHASRATDAL